MHWTIADYKAGRCSIDMVGQEMDDDVPPPSPVPEKATEPAPDTPMTPLALRERLQRKLASKSVDDYLDKNPRELVRMAQKFLPSEPAQASKPDNGPGLYDFPEWIDWSTRLSYQTRMPLASGQSVELPPMARAFNEFRTVAANEREKAQEAGEAYPIVPARIFNEEIEIARAQASARLAAQREVPVAPALPETPEE